MEDMVSAKKACQYQYSPGLDQIRCHQAIRSKLKISGVVAFLSYLLKAVYF